MEHVLLRCNATPPGAIWHLARNMWPHDPHLWPEISLGIILGCGSISLPVRNPRNPGENQTQDTAPKGAMRLLQILISEAAHLIWVLRCERVIQGRPHSMSDIRHRWLQVINVRLTNDKITASKIKRDKKSLQKVADTWEHVLRKEMDLPHGWITSREVLVGRRPHALS
jgi:hypothetical protein